MKIKTENLTGLALDWAVAQCEAIELHPHEHTNMYLYSSAFSNLWAPSQAHAGGWNITGPIIEREGIALELFKGLPGQWKAFDFNKGEGYSGETPLIAALRCYVAGKLGEEVDIPDNLMN